MDYGDMEKWMEIKNKWVQGRMFILPIAAAVILMVMGFSSFYTVKADEKAVVQRFGRYVRTTGPGLHFKLPFGMEKATNVKVKYYYKEEFGFRTEKPGIRTYYSQKNYDDESIMLTGDLNIADVEWIIQFNVSDPYKVLFKVRNPVRIVRDIGEAVMRQVVGDKSITRVLTVGREEINQEVKKKMQKILDYYDSGIHLLTIQLQNVNPPEPVKPSFDEVNEAEQEREKLVNQAWKNYNSKIPMAKGGAEKTIREAEGYALNRINRAKGDADRFISIYNEYKLAEDVTKRRMYLETMAEILPKAGKKYIVDPEQKSVLPIVRIGEEAVQ